MIVLNYNIEQTEFTSSDNNSIIKGFFYEPLCKPIAVLQVSHGMCEYIRRYDHFADYLTSKGIVVCGNDHLGHGSSVKSDDDLGYFGGNNCYKHLIMDLHSMTLIAKTKYPDLPYFMLGHSMGSFIARSYISLFGEELDGIIISGTSGTNPMAKIGKVIAKTVGIIKGEKYRSKMLNNLSFGNYNKRYEKPKSFFSWLSTDEQIVDKYEKDSKCNFVFTADGFANISALLALVSTKQWYYSVPEALPIFIISGDMDPVGNYSTGIKEVYSKLKASGNSDISLKLYKNMRHETLNEIGKEQVYEDIYKWLNKHIKEKSSV